MLNLVANGPSGYTINNSLRFRSSASAYLNRTFTTPTNNKIFTYSAWVKRGALTNYYALLSPASSGTGYTTLRFESNDVLIFQEFTGSVYNYQFATTQVFRDPSAWYHIVVAVDTTQATSSNRVKIYVNGSQITSFGTASYPTQNSNPNFNSAVVHRIGANNYTGNPEQYFDGYMTEVNFIDGQALTPSSFGSTNATTGVWQPAKYTGTYGTNGFYLNFNSIALTSGSNTGLGKDNSGNGNYWNTNNISVTAGTTYDAMTDVPTLTSATVANYPTLNPLNPFKTYVTLSNANLTATGNSAANTDTVYSTMGSLSTSIYWEYTCVTVGSSYGRTGAITTFPITAGGVPGEPWSSGFGWRQDGYLVLPSGNTAVLPTFTTGDVLGFALNPTAGTCALYKNGTLSYTVTGLSTTSTFFPATAEYNGSVGAYNFGQRPFSYTPPSGYVALNTYNLPSSTISQGNKYMDATLYTGTGSNLTISTNNIDLSTNGLVWVKCRTAAENNFLFDSLRTTGAKYSYSLTSNDTSAEASSTAVTSPTTSSYTNASGGNPTNTSGRNYVQWLWQAGSSAASSNTNGSITSTVSVNTTAGFSVVTYTGNETTGATVGHGLGIVPKMIIIKSRTTAQNWPVYHVSTGNTGACLLNLTNAFVTAAGDWNNTTPSSTVITLGGGAQSDRYNTNKSGDNYVAYCWAEISGFSKFGSYTGNGSTDGPFVYTGFRPKFVLTKRTDSSTNGFWNIYDSARNGYNDINNELYPNSSSAEDNSVQVELLSNGFKCINTLYPNTSGGTYIYAAFAENPFKNSLAR